MSSVPSLTWEAGAGDQRTWEDTFFFSNQKHSPILAERTDGSYLQVRVAPGVSCSPWSKGLKPRRWDILVGIPGGQALCVA